MGGGEEALSGVWGNIMKIGNKLDKPRADFSGSFCRCLGGDFRLWEDNWPNSKCFVSLCPRLFSLEMEKGVNEYFTTFWSSLKSANQSFPNMGK